MVPAASARSSKTTVPRRRQRKDVEEVNNTRQPPQRKRSKISPTKELRHGDDDHVDEDGQDINGSASNGHLPAASSSLAHQIPLRARSSYGHDRSRTRPSSNVSVLTENPNYRIEDLQNFPDELKGSHAVYRGVCAPWTTKVLAITLQQAFVWDTTAASATTMCRKFDFANPSRNNEELPFGSLVYGGSSETGLLIVSPASGKVTFWESVENADALKLFERRRYGTEGSIKGMAYGERVVDLQDVSEAGFVLTLSSGRTVHLAVRDPQGHPNIQSRILESNHNSGAGLFSGFKSVFSSGNHLKNVTAVHSQSLRHHGTSRLVIANAQARFHLWLLNWSGQPSFNEEVDAHDHILSAIFSESPNSSDCQLNFVLLDFAILDGERAQKKASTNSADDETIDLLSLLLVTGPETARYVLIDLRISNGSVSIGRSMPINSYTPPPVILEASKARLCLSSTQKTACVVARDAFTLMSVVSPSGDSESRDRKATKARKRYEDTIYLRDRDDLAIVGAGQETSAPGRTQYAVLRIIIRNFGLVRIVIEEPDDLRKGITRYPPDAKNVLEQAIFKGISAENPLDLVRASKTAFTLHDIEAAAVAISEEITSSKSAFIQPLLSMDQHLEQRAKALHNLALHLKNNYAALSTEARWHLISMAEKTVAAKRIWSTYELQAEQEPEDPRLLPELIEYLPEEVKTQAGSDFGESDQLRLWFQRDVASLENLIPWAFQGVIEMNKLEEFADERKLLPIVSDADDLVIGALETAWQFRTENAWLYNLPTEGTIEHGLLSAGYKGLPRPWTSQYAVANKSRDLTLNGSTIITNVGENNLEESRGQPSSVLKIAEDNPHLIRLCCKSYKEMCSWLLDNAHIKDNLAKKNFVENEMNEARQTMLTKLPDIGMGEKALGLAEEYADMSSLVVIFGVEIREWSRILAEETRKASDETHNNGDQSDELEAANQNILVAKNRIQELDSRLRRYFEKFGFSWAEALYSAYAKNKGYIKILDASAYPWQAEEVSQYLKATSRRQRLGWIDDAVARRDFTRASASLTNVAGEENSLWSKKLELSLAKLALAAATENRESSDKAQDADRIQDDAQALMQIQHKLADHTFPSMYNALDEGSELSLLMQDFGRQKTGGRPSLQQLLERGLDSLRASTVMDPEQLIDVLTLMDHHPCDMRNRDISGDEFFLALQVLQHSGFVAMSDRYQTLLKIIWRRCFMEDQWDEINNTSHRTDEAISHSLERTTLFRTLYKGTKCSLFTGSNAIPILNTEDVVGAGSSPDEYKDRFPEEDLRIPIAQDTAREDGVIQSLVKEQRLDSWVARTKDWMTKCLDAEAQAKTDEDRKIHEAANKQRAKEKSR